MKRYLLSFVAAFAFIGVGTVSAAPGPADIQAIGNNLGPTVEALADGLGTTVNTLLTDPGHNAVATSAALGTTLVSTTKALIDGAPSLAAVSSFGVVNTVNYNIQQFLHPSLNAIDNPTSANIQAALAPEDINTIADNLQTVPFHLLEGYGFTGPDGIYPYGTGLRNAAIALLQGHLAGSNSLGEGSVLESAIGGPTTMASLLLFPSNYYPLAAVASNLVLVPAAAYPQLEQVQPLATQLADAGAPLTDPIVGILKKGF